MGLTNTQVARSLACSMKKKLLDVDIRANGDGVEGANVAPKARKRGRKAKEGAGVVANKRAKVADGGDDDVEEEGVDGALVKDEDDGEGENPAVGLGAED